MSESKRYTLLNERYGSFIPGFASPYYWFYRNIFSRLSEGTNYENIIGKSISRPFLKIKYSISQLWSRLPAAGVTLGDCTVCVAVIASNDQLVALTPTSFTPGSSDTVGNWLLQPIPERATFDGANVRVLKMRKHRLRFGAHVEAGSGLTAFGESHLTGSLKIRWRGNKTYELDDGVRADWLKGWNYYIVVGVQVPSSATVVVPTPWWPEVTMDTHLYFKDL